MTKRRLSDWLEAHLEFTEISESPVSYHTWAGLSCVASVLQRKVYMSMGHTTLYPNMYVVLIGPTGGRKGEPIDIVRWFLEEVNVLVVEEDITEEALIKELSDSENSFKDEETGAIKWHSCMTICAEELAVFLRERNTRLQAYLTNWFDSRDKWGRRTKQSTTENILGVYVNLLASSAPDWLPYILTREAIGGGFTGRCIFVVEQGKRQTIVDPDVRPLNSKLREDILHDLEIIKMLSGRYRFDEDAKKAYGEWYSGFSESIVEPLQGASLAGYVTRRQTHLRKVAMCLAASYKDELVITLDDFNRAKALLEATEVNMSLAFQGLSKAKYVEETEAILKYIKEKGSVKRSDLLLKFYRSVDDNALESIITVLTQMKVIQVSIMTEEADRRYIYKGKV